MIADHTVETFAIRAALGNNGGAWATHYTEAQKDHWRQWVRDLAMQMAAYEYATTVSDHMRGGKEKPRPSE